MDAISLLKRDHREVTDLFDAFEKEATNKAQIASEICRLLTIHAQIEEEIFYPAAREAFNADDEGDDLLDEAEVEHAGAKDLIAQIEEGGEADDLFEAKVKVLGEYVKHHVREEEEEMFPKLNKTTLGLESLGRELEKRKTELLGQVSPAQRSSRARSMPKRRSSKGKRVSAPKPSVSRTATKSARKSAKKK